MGKTDKLSVFISLVLRHNPGAAGITLDEHGWADVQKLLEGVSATGRKIDMAVLEEIVKYDSKQRYSFNEDRFLKSIHAEGLKPMSRLYVHLSKDVETALKVGKRHGTPVVLKVRSGAMYREGYKFYLSENGVWLTKMVSNQYLEK